MYWLWPSILWSFALFKWSRSWHWNIKKDFGTQIHFKLSWKLQCETLVSNADSQLGLVRRSGYFINIAKQKCTLYLTMVPSIFQHCFQVWAPQKNLPPCNWFHSRCAIKWMSKESHMSYPDHLFSQKQRDLNWTEESIL